MNVSMRVNKKGDAKGRLSHLMRTLAGGPKRVKVGFPRGRVPGGIIMRAIYNEFGTTRIPERPFMRITMRTNRAKYQRFLATNARWILNESVTINSALRRLGMIAVGDIQDMISSNVPPPNAPSTVRRKGSSTTLIDTGNMRQAVTYEVE